MKNILLITLLLGFLTNFSVLAQTKPQGQTLQDTAETLQQLNEGKIKELESLEKLYNRLSADIVLNDQLIDKILNEGDQERTIGLSCYATCRFGANVTCVGNPCTVYPGYGCEAVRPDFSIDSKRCVDFGTHQ